MRTLLRSSLVALSTLTFTLCCAESFAQEGGAEQLALRGGLDNLDGAYTEAIVQRGGEGDHRLGVRLRAGLVRERFIGGYRVDDGAALQLAPRAFFSLRDRGATRFGLLTEVGLRRLAVQDETPAGSRSLSLTTRLAPTLNHAVSERLDVVASVQCDTDLALQPATELETLAQSMDFGARYWLSPHVALTLNGIVGGAFGHGGDGAKVRWASTVGVAYALGGGKREVAAEGQKPSGGVPFFLGAGWRGSLIGGHMSHGPETRFGAILWKSRLKVGVSTLNRPGPMNPAEFTLTLPQGETYNGKGELPLRSDGSTFGLFLAPQIGLGDALTLELPVTIGQAGYGFYIQGEDRNTPDGRRVSEWENELQDGRDAGFGLAVDAGARLRAKFGDADWIQPSLGVHYLVTPGYDAFLRDDYGGLSVSAGVQFAAF